MSQFISRRVLDEALYSDVGDVTKYEIGPPPEGRFSKDSSVDIFEVCNVNAIVSTGLTDEEMRDTMKVLSPVAPEELH